MLNLQILVCTLHLNSTSQFRLVTFEVSVGTGGECLPCSPAHLWVICFNGSIVFQSHLAGHLGCFQPIITINDIAKKVRLASAMSYRRAPK